MNSYFLTPNIAAETTNDEVDLLSNGFKLRRNILDRMKWK